MNKSVKKEVNHKIRNRVAILRGLLIVVGIILIGRLFYIQIIRHEHYQAQALAEHIKKFEINAPRGLIKMQDGSDVVPVVLNEQRYIIFADPNYIENANSTADRLVGLIGGKKEELLKKLATKNSRYVVIAKKLTKEQADRVDSLKLKGIGKKEFSMRTYPQADMASQLLGFVNDDNIGQYGIEGYLDERLKGKSGLEKAITDVRGVPLAVNNDNILKQPIPGEDINLTIDIGMQKTAEDALKNGMERTKAVRGTVIIMEANSGAIKAIANSPTYDPADYQKVTDQSVFSNMAVNMAWEPGSVMKPLLFGAAFTEGTANPDTSFYDPGFVIVDGSKISDSVNWGAQTMTLHDVINKSLNTGAVFVLKTLGDGDINEKARTTWYDYLSNHYLFGKKTGIEQSGESNGILGGPNEGYGVSVRYANMAFGQGITLTPIQLVAAYAALLNGGTYYKPSLVNTTDKQGKIVPFKPTIVKQAVISATAGNQIRDLLQKSLEINNKTAMRPGYILGAKSGTALIPDSKGNYRTDAFNGVYVGYLGGDNVEYIILVRFDEPKTSASGFASGEAAKTWAEISNKLIDSYAIRPKSI
ncbi:MAG: penicillin-binding protein 2 [Candidatus Saccharibacteria bacterium]